MMIAPQAWTAEPFDGRRRFSTFRAERRFERNQAGPAFRTCPSPPALENRSVTDCTCDWEQEIENVIEQSAFGETQRAKSVYAEHAHLQTGRNHKGHKMLKGIYCASCASCGSFPFFLTIAVTSDAVF